MKIKGLKRIGTLLISAMLIFSLTACANNGAKDNTSSTQSSNPSSAEVSSQEPVTTDIVDREGNTIKVPEKVEKIVSMAPSITETLVHLGFADKLVAIDKYSVDIEGVPANLPVYDMMAPDTESIAALKPDIIFATGMSKAKGDDPFKPVTDLGVLMTYIPSSVSIDGIKGDIKFIGQVTKSDDKAQSIITEMEKGIEEILAKIGDAKSDKTVYFEIAGAPNLYSFGKGTFLNEIIEMLGAKNVLADQDSWVSISEEAIIDKNPDVIFTNVDYVEDPVGEILSRNGWNVVSAVKNKAVYSIAKNASSRSNEYITIAINEMAAALYPDLFK